MNAKNAKLKQYLQFCTAVFAIASAAASLTTVPPWALHASIAVTLVSAAVGIYLFLRDHPHRAYLLHKLIPYAKPTVRYVRNEAELATVARLDTYYYGDESVDFAGLREWWRRYPKGVFILYDRSTIAGAIGMWPLSKKTFNEMKEGRLDEARLRGTNIVRNNDSRPRRYWYFADIVLHAKWKDKRNSLHFIEQAVRAWIADGQIAPEVDIVSLGYSDDGEHLLRKFGFSEAARSPAGHPVYWRTATREELLDDLRTYVVTPQELAASKGGWWNKFRRKS